MQSLSDTLIDEAEKKVGISINEQEAEKNVLKQAQEA